MMATEMMTSVLANFGWRDGDRVIHAYTRANGIVSAAGCETAADITVRGDDGVLWRPVMRHGRDGAQSSVPGWHLCADWIGDRYSTGAWFSVDGDEWYTSVGEPVSDDRFDLASIMLVGGPRDGTIVA